MKNRWLLLLPVLILLGIGIKLLVPKQQMEIEDGTGNIANLSVLYRKYIEQHEGHFPYATDEKSFLDALRPYAPKPAEIDDFFIDPITQDHYRINPWFNGKSIKEADAAMILLYEPKVIRYPSGRAFRILMYADGTIHYIEQKDWPVLARKSHLPE